MPVRIPPQSKVRQPEAPVPAAQRPAGGTSTPAPVAAAKDLFSSAVRAVTNLISPGPLAPPAANPFEGTDLSSAEQSRLLARTGGVGESPEVTRLAREISTATSGLPAKERTALLRPIADPVPGDRAKFVGDLVSSQGWTRGTAEQRRQLASIAAGVAGAEGQAALLALAADPSKLAAADFKGGDLLTHLEALAARPLNPAVEEGRAALLSSVLDDLANPGKVKQEDFSTCTVTSIQYELAGEHPAEYARLMASLAGPSGRAELKGGGVLELQRDYLPQVSGQPQPAADARTASQALFQTAAMEYGNGEDDYAAVCTVEAAPTPDCSVIPGSEEQYPGLDAPGLRRVLQGVFGEQFAKLHERGLSAGEQQKFLEELDATRSRPVLLALKVAGNDYAKHVVTFLKVDGDRVYFRNPYGDKYLSESTELLGARVEDAEAGIYSFPLKDFSARVGEVDAPVAQINRFGA